MVEKKLNIYEVGPRDGFQSVSTDCGIINTETKIEIITGLINSGLKHIQITSFVSPKAIPQLADAKIVTENLLENNKDIDLYALVPNLFGAKRAYELDMKKVAYVVSFSKSHNKANINRTHEESFNEFKKIREELPDLKISLNLATTFGCPFEGKYRNPDKVVEFIQPYIDLGVNDLVLCDTVGLADPKQVENFISHIRKRYPGLELGVHFHDTRGLGMANSIKAIELGVKNIEVALGGLGGCPFAPGASGNLSSEDLVWALNEMEYDTGIDFDKMVKLAKKQKELIPGNYSGNHINILEKGE